MKRILNLILLLHLLPSYINAQIDSSFDLNQALGTMMQLEQQYSESPSINVANELVILYKTISEHNNDTTDYFTISRCRMLAEIHKYDEAIVLSDSLYDKDKALFKERLLLMKASFENDSVSFNLHLHRIQDYLNSITSKYIDIEDSLMRLPLDAGFSHSDDIYVHLMSRLKYCYNSVNNGIESTCWQLIENANRKKWDISQLNWFLKYIYEFDYMSLTWW